MLSNNLIGFSMLWVILLHVPGMPPGGHLNATPDREPDPGFQPATAHAFDECAETKTPLGVSRTLPGEQSSASPSSAHPAPGPSFDIIINEFLYRPGRQVLRFIELYNRGEQTVDLRGWYVGRGVGRPSRIETPQALLEPGEYLVLTPPGNPLSAQLPNTVTLSDFPSLSRLGDALYLQNRQRQRRDSLHYQPEWGGNHDGISLERRHPHGASNDPDNWQSHPYSHSAGQRNQGHKSQLSPPEPVIALWEPGDGIRVRFSRFIRNTAQLRFLLDGKEVPKGSYDPFQAGTWLLPFPGHLPADRTVTLEVEHITDFTGLHTARSHIPVARRPANNDLIINELLYQPHASQYGPHSDQSQYVELYNRSAFPVSLEGLLIHDKPDRLGNVRTIAPVNSQNQWLEADSYAIFHADTASHFSDSRIASAFSISPKVRRLRADRQTLGLTTSASAVYLADANLVVIDSVYYDPDWHTPNRMETRGISLERIDPGGAGNEASNWGSSADAEGGTPGRKNSINAAPAAPMPNIGIGVEPNPFSPDQSGKDDHLFITYRLDQPDYMMRVRIFDRYGRHVSTLADGQPAGKRGQLQWDGFHQDGTPGRIGIYVVLFEVYNSLRGGSHRFRETVVLARRLE